MYIHAPYKPTILTLFHSRLVSLESCRNYSLKIAVKRYRNIYVHMQSHSIYHFLWPPKAQIQTDIKSCINFQFWVDFTEPLSLLGLPQLLILVFKFSNWKNSKRFLHDFQLLYHCESSLLSLNEHILYILYLWFIRVQKRKQGKMLTN